MGRSGSGKSTIANLVTRFYDIEREILLDGVNIQDYCLSNLRENFVLWFPQQSIYFNDVPLRIILLMPRRIYSREEIIAAAKARLML